MTFADQVLRKRPSVYLEISLEELSTNSISLVLLDRSVRLWTERVARSGAASVDHLSWLRLCLLLWLWLTMHQAVDVGIDIRVIKDNLTAINVTLLISYVQIRLA